jgi:hypothetical protein
LALDTHQGFIYGVTPAREVLKPFQPGFSPLDEESFFQLFKAHLL